jgi:hypothetical protein
MRVHDLSARPNAASGGQTVNGPKPGPVSGEWHLNPPEAGVGPIFQNYRPFPRVRLGCSE